MKKTIKLEDCNSKVQEIHKKIIELAKDLVPSGYELDSVTIESKPIELKPAH